MNELQNWAERRLGKGTVVEGVSRGKTTGELELEIRHCRLDGEHAFIAFFENEEVASISFTETKNAIQPYRMKGKEDQAADNEFQEFHNPQELILYNMGGLRGKGIMSALHAHFLDHIAENPKIKSVFREAFFKNNGWTGHLEKIGGEINEHGVSWNMKKLRNKKPWSAWLLK